VPAEPQRFDPARILAVLERHGVDYVMVGGFASQLHGARRRSYDIDFVPAATEANDDRLASALRELGARLRVAGLADEEARQLPVTIDAATLQAFGSTTWTTDAGPLDVLRGLPVTGGSTFDELVQRCTAVSVGGIVIHVASLDDISTARPMPTAPETKRPSPNSTSSVERHPTPDHPTRHEAGSPGDPSDRDGNLATNCSGLELAHRVGRSVE
jgi:hypothetical protein